MQIDQRDREADIRLLCDIMEIRPAICSELIAGVTTPMIDEKLALIARHRTADTARIAEMEKAILAMKNAQHREEEDYRKAELFALIATTALGGQP